MGVIWAKSRGLRETSHECIWDENLPDRHNCRYKRPQGRSTPDKFEEWQGDQCAWSWMKEREWKRLLQRDRGDGATVTWLQFIVMILAFTVDKTENLWRVLRRWWFTLTCIFFQDHPGYYVRLLLEKVWRRQMQRQPLGSFCKNSDETWWKHNSDGRWWEAVTS